MPTFVATLHFHNFDKDAVTVTVEAADKTAASDRVFDLLAPVEPVEEVDVLTLDEFAEYFGDYEPHLFLTVEQLL